MKILGVNSSPNADGSTAALIDMVLAECRLLGASCERIDLRDYHLMDCRICTETCTGTGSCLQDDFIQLKAKILEADGLVIGSPYYGGKPADKLTLLAERLSLTATVNEAGRKRYTLGVSASAGDSSEDVARWCSRLKDGTVKYGFTESAWLHAATLEYAVPGDMKNDAQLAAKVREAAGKFMKDIGGRKTGLVYRLKKFLGLVED